MRRGTFQWFRLLKSRLLKSKIPVDRGWDASPVEWLTPGMQNVFSPFQEQAVFVQHPSGLRNITLQCRY